MKNVKAFIFDLDGVIVDTAKYHYLAWKKIANELGIDFTHEHNELLKELVEFAHWILSLN
jgi:beta-phosphoglucomutase